MDASGADKLILLVQTNQVYDKSAAGYKVKDALKKGDICQWRPHRNVDSAINITTSTGSGFWPQRRVLIGRISISGDSLLFDGRTDTIKTDHYRR